ncbi:MAG: hypothetical protein VW378_02440 [bacterium]
MLAKNDYSAIIDANINRASEGLRALEDYCRFECGNKALTDALAGLRKKINGVYPDRQAHLMARDTSQDQRAKETLPSRLSLQALLTANFKRATEALRVLEEYSGNALFNTLRYDVYEIEKALCLTALKPKILSGLYLISSDVEELEKGMTMGVSRTVSLFLKLIFIEK